jgi:hypothetical protein
VRSVAWQQAGRSGEEASTKAGSLTAGRVAGWARRRTKKDTPSECIKSLVKKPKKQEDCGVCGEEDRESKLWQGGCEGGRKRTEEGEELRICTPPKRE